MTSSNKRGARKNPMSNRSSLSTPLETLNQFLNHNRFLVRHIYHPKSNPWRGCCTVHIGDSCGLWIKPKSKIWKLGRARFNSQHQEQLYNFTPVDVICRRDHWLTGLSPQPCPLGFAEGVSEVNSAITKKRKWLLCQSSTKHFQIWFLGAGAAKMKMRLALTWCLRAKMKGRNLSHFFCRAMGPSCSTNNAGEILLSKVFFGYSNLVLSQECAERHWWSRRWWGFRFFCCVRFWRASRPSDVTAAEACCTRWRVTAPVQRGRSRVPRTNPQDNFKNAMPCFRGELQTCGPF